MIMLSGTVYAMPLRKQKHQRIHDIILYAEAQTGRFYYYLFSIWRIGVW